MAERGASKTSAARAGPSAGTRRSSRAEAHPAAARRAARRHAREGAAGAVAPLLVDARRQLRSCRARAPPRDFRVDAKACALPSASPRMVTTPSSRLVTRLICSTSAPGHGARATDVGAERAQLRSPRSSVAPSAASASSRLRFVVEHVGDTRVVQFAAAASALVSRGRARRRRASMKASGRRRAYPAAAKASRSVAPRSMAS